MVLYHCARCGLDFANNSVIGGPGATVVISNVQVPCPRCGTWARSYDGTYLWFPSIEEVIRHATITAKQAKRIQRKILEAHSPETLRESIDVISKEVGDAVKTVLEKTKGETEGDKWKWLYRLAALVGIVAGINTFSADYNIDAAIKWLRSNEPELSQGQSDKKTSSETVKQPKKNRLGGP